MESPERALVAALRQALTELGVATAAQLQVAIGRSQPTVSRLLGAMGPELLVLGQGRRTRYTLAEPFGGLPARQTLHWVHADGRIEAWGTVAVATGQRIHLEAPGLDLLTQGQLPWPLAPLRIEGFLGRLWAQRLALQGLDRQPERWTVAQQVFAAALQPDAPGALVLGEPRASALPVLPTSAKEPTSPGSTSSGVSAPAATAASPPAARPDANLDDLAADVAATLPAGSSAGGEQAKFLARRADGRAVLVKFSPPRGTPFGERWHDLLHAEALALQVLSDHGVTVAASQVIESVARTYLVSERFDRLLPVDGRGFEGRRHAVPLHAVHEAFVGGPRQHWAATAQALVRQQRLPAEAGPQVEALLRFGRLIGNSDMHFGNLSLWVAPDDVAAGRFTLAPVYDMLPMRWRPDVQTGSLDLSPFFPEPMDLQSPARPVAQAFWARAADHPGLTADFRRLAGQMFDRLGV
ncbi:MAG: HipA domain-containing protein [Rubrivivax sp.]